jgi:hypothetical protein
MPTDMLPLLATAFVTGLLGSAHCFGMCAGISGLFAVNAEVAALKTQVPRAIAYNSGRVLSYALLGLLVALVGNTTVVAIPELAAPIRLASGILIILVGVQLASNWRLLKPLESAGARLWQKIAPVAKGLVPVESLGQALGLGLVWGWLPCGLVYSVLLLAAATAEPLGGALVMVAFGLGTMPAMIATGVSASRLARFMSGKRLGAGLLIILLGLATILMPLLKLAGTSSHHSM